MRPKSGSAIFLRYFTVLPQSQVVEEVVEEF
jgi:hypothetical protein